MKKYKDLIGNIGILTISNFGSKLLSFFLIQLYTSYLTTEEYGTFDIIFTTISLLIPILTMNILESTLRFSLEEKTEKKEVVKITNKYINISLVFLFIITIINKLLNIIPSINNYLMYFIVFYVITLLYQYLQNFSRGMNKIFDLGISGILNSIISLILNIYFLAFLKLGIEGYLLANIIANIIATIYLIIRIKFIKFICYKNINKNLEKEMVDYSKPLVLNSVSWWINNSADRYIVTWFKGIAENGIYSVSYKIPTILSVFQTIFNQAWLLSSVKEYKNKDSEKFFGTIYNMYNMLMVIACSGLILFIQLVAKILFAKEFFIAWRYVPFLMISVVFGALSGMLGGIFQAEKDSKFLSFTTIIGAIINIILNLILVYYFGAMGAAISTAISYFVVWICRLKKSKKYINFNVYYIRDCFCYTLLVIQSILLIFINNYSILYSIQVLLVLIIIFSFKSEIIKLLKKLKERKINNV